MQTEQQMPIFSRSFDLMVWLLQVTRHFLRMHRHDFTQRLLIACFDLRECLEIANLRRGVALTKNLHETIKALTCFKPNMHFTALME